MQKRQTLQGQTLQGRTLKGWMVLLALFLGVGVMGAIRGGRPGGDVIWATSYEAGVRQARQTGKPLLLSFHTPGCGWCRKMDAETFTDPKVVETAQQYICVRVDSDVDGRLVQQYGVMEYPLTLILTPEEKEVARFSGYVAPDRFAPAMDTLLKAVREQQTAEEHKKTQGETN